MGEVIRTPEKPPPIVKSLTRRQFLLSSTAAGAAMLLSGTSDAPPRLAQRPRHSILVDVSTCVACMRCVAACESYHIQYDRLPTKGTAYTSVAVVDNVTNVPELCLQCYDSPCAKVCITHALTQLDYGPVVYDRNKCVGCLLCVNQCPFGSISFDPVEKKIYKCDMCHKAVEEGKEPYCVEICPTGTRSFGLYETKLEEGMKLAEEKHGVLLYPRDSGTLYVLSDKELEKLADSTNVAVIKREYPADSRWVADLLKYSRVAWIPVTLGAAFYIAKWARSQSNGAA